MMTIKTVLGLYEAALNTNDVDAILDLYSTEPVFMPQHSTALVGRDAVRAGYKQVFATLKLNVQFTIHEIEEVGNWAWVRTSSAGTTRVLDSGVDVNEGNNELFVFRNEVGRWKIYRYLFATSQPRT